MPRNKESFWLPHLAPIIIIFGVVLFGIMYSLQDIFYAQEEMQARFAFTETPPVAIVGEHQEAKVGDTVILDGSRSYDPDGEISEFLWLGLPQNPTIIKLNGADSATASFITEIEGNYIFTLTVTDNDGMQNKDSILITVKSQG